VVAVIGYFPVHRQGAVHQSPRLFFYLTTIALMDSCCLRLPEPAPPWKIHSKQRRQELERRSRFFSRRRYGLRLLDRRNLCPQFRGSRGELQGMSQAARLLAPQDPFESLLWIALAVTVGICEETIFRGYLQRPFAAWTRSAPIGVLLSALFGAGHIYQGAKATVVMACAA
jgi:membrane protease YdiL (CAAX protease family)